MEFQTSFSKPNRKFPQQERDFPFPIKTKTYEGGTYVDLAGSCGTLSMIMDASLRPMELDPIPDSPGILRPSRRCCCSSFAIRFMCSLASFSCV